MRWIHVGAMVLALSLSSGSALLACGDHVPAPSPVQQYVPQSQPEPVQLASNVKGLQLAGAGLGSAIIAGSIAWSLARRKT